MVEWTYAEGAGGGYVPSPIAGQSGQYWYGVNYAADDPLLSNVNDPEYTGHDCSEPACSPRCTAPHGYCVKGECYCAAGFRGPDCSLQECPLDCAGHGACLNGTCKCDVGYSGADCTIGACANGCSGRREVRRDK